MARFPTEVNTNEWCERWLYVRTQPDFRTPADVSIGSPKNHTDNTNMAEAIAWRLR